MPESLMIDLQLLLQVLLFLLFHAVSRLMPGWGFMRWWTWGWAALAALLLVYRLSVVPGVPALYGAEIYPRISPVAALLQITFFLLGAITLLRGREPSSGSIRVTVGGAILLGGLIGFSGAALFTDDTLSFAFRAFPRSAGLAVAMPLCAFAFWRILGGGRGWLVAVAPLGFLLYGLNQVAYAVAAAAELLRAWPGVEPFGAFGIPFIFSPYATLSDIAWTSAIGLGTVVVLVSEVRRVQRALEESERRFRRVFEWAPTGMALLDQAGRITGTNRAYRRLLSRSPEGLEGRFLHDLVGPEDRERVEGLVNAAVDRAVPGVIEEAVAYHRSDGATMRADTSLSLVRTGEAGQRELVAQLEDVTERRALERHLRQAQKLEAIGSLAAGMAHDFNNLLQSVRGNAELVLMDQEPGSPWREELEEIGIAAARGKEISDQMLALAGQATFQRRGLDLRTFFLETEEFLRSLLPAEARLVIECMGTPRALADPERLLQLVSNLLSNAGEALGGPPDGPEPRVTGGEGGPGWEARVEVRVDLVKTGDVPDRGRFLPHLPERDRWVRLRVSDTGHGMDPETLQRIYDPFFTTRVLGRGLGIPAVLGIVKAHGGAMAVESREGRGATVTVLLPPEDGPVPEGDGKAEGKVARTDLIAPS